MRPADPAPPMPPQGPAEPLPNAGAEGPDPAARTPLERPPSGTPGTAPPPLRDTTTSPKSRSRGRTDAGERSPHPPSQGSAPRTSLPGGTLPRRYLTGPRRSTRSPWRAATPAEAPRAGGGAKPSAQRSPLGPADFGPADSARRQHRPPPAGPKWRRSAERPATAPRVRRLRAPLEAGGSREASDGKQPPGGAARGAEPARVAPPPRPRGRVRERRVLGNQNELSDGKPF